MQIWKSLYMSPYIYIYIYIPENFTFLIQRILELFAREI